MSAAAMLDQFVAAAQANPLSVVLAALVGIVVAWLLFAGPAKKAGPKKSWSEDRFPAAEAKKVAEEFTLQSLRSDFFNNPFKYYHGMLTCIAPAACCGHRLVRITR